MHSDVLNLVDPTGEFGYAQMMVSMAVLIALDVMAFPTNVNAPDYLGPIYHDNSGDMAIGMAMSLVLAPPLHYVSETIVSPLWSWLKVSLSDDAASTSFAQAGENFGVTGFPGAQGIQVAGRLSPAEMAELTIKYNREFSLVYRYGPGTNGGGGTYWLYSGDVKSVSVPIDSDVYWIYHTHPGGTAAASPADKNVMYFLQNAQIRGGYPVQETSRIIPVGKETMSFTVPRP